MIMPRSRPKGVRRSFRQEMKRPIEERVPMLDFTRSPEGERDCRVKTRARALPNGRVDDGDRGRPHGHADQRAP